MSRPLSRSAGLLGYFAAIFGPAPTGVILSRRRAKPERTPAWQLKKRRRKIAHASRMRNR